jgi:uncharacterized protein
MSVDRSRRDFIRNAILTAGALHASAPWQGSHALASASPGNLSAFRPVDFSRVMLTDAFWKPKQQLVASVTMQACIVQTEQKSGRIRNFEKAARRQGEKHEGLFYDDADVYKALEAVAYSLYVRPDLVLQEKADSWIEKIALAQLPDGYLNTYFTLTGLDKRWTDVGMHEDFCAGHLIEAAIAYAHATGKRNLLDVAVRFADHIDATLRAPDRHWISGHEEIELAVMKLYRLNGEERYLKLAEWFLRQRGRGYGTSAVLGNIDAAYWQDQAPVDAQREIVGHAVRAMYLYCGATDVAAATGDSRYALAMKAVWKDVVQRKMYVTGGIGSALHHEGMAPAFDLPNLQAYCETCASCGMVFWNHRMAQLNGDSRYFDVLERSLYNGALAGLSLSGDRFFYANPLASSASTPSEFFGLGRREWFGTACCPSNIARLVTSLGAYVYGEGMDSIWVNLYVGSIAHLRVNGAPITLTTTTSYPWEGRVTLSMRPERPIHCAVRLRIPGWVRGEATPGGLYECKDAKTGEVGVRVNGRQTPVQEENGYAVIRRQWRRGDVIELELPMSVQRVIAKDEVQADRGRFVLQRGPMIYCVEGADNQGEAWNLIASTENSFTAAPHQVVREPVVAIKGNAESFRSDSDGKGVVRNQVPLTAIPYYAWANRDNYEMQVWLPSTVRGIKING